MAVPLLLFALQSLYAQPAPATDRPGSETATAAPPPSSVETYSGPAKTLKDQALLLKSFVELGADAVVQAAFNDLVTLFADDSQALAKAIDDAADFYRQAGRDDPALRFCTVLVERFPDDPAALSAKGRMAIIYIEKGDAANAKTWTDRLIADTDDLAKSITACDQVIEIARFYGTYLKDHVMDQDVYERLHAHSKKAYDEATTPTVKMNALALTAWSDVMLKNFEASQTEVGELRKNYAASPMLPIYLSEIGEEYFNKKMYAECIPYCEYVLNNVPRGELGLKMLKILAAAQFQLKNDAAAQELIGRIDKDYAGDKGLPEAMLYVTRSLYKMKRYDLVTVFGRRSLETWPDDRGYPQMFVFFVAAYDKLGDNEAVRTAIRAFYEKYFGKPSLTKAGLDAVIDNQMSRDVFEVGWRFREVGLYERAVDILTRFLERWTGHLNTIDAYRELAIAYFCLGNDEAERRTVDELMALYYDTNPKFKRVFYTLGREYYLFAVTIPFQNQARWRAGFQRTKEIFTIYNGKYADHEGLIFQACCCQLLGDYAEALAIYDRVISQFTIDCDALYVYIGSGICYRGLLDKKELDPATAFQKMEAAYRYVMESPLAKPDAIETAALGLARVYADARNPEAQNVRETKLQKLIATLQERGAYAAADKIFDQFLGAMLKSNASSGPVRRASGAYD